MHDGVKELMQASWYGYEIKEVIVRMVESRGGDRIMLDDVMGRIGRYKLGHQARS